VAHKVASSIPKVINKRRNTAIMYHGKKDVSNSSKRDLGIKKRWKIEKKTEDW